MIIAATTFWQNPAVVGLIIAIPATVLGYLGYRRSRGIDDAAKLASKAEGQATSIAQVVSGLNGVITAVQSDNVDLRAEVREIRARLDAIEQGNVDLRAKNRELEREIGVLHEENEALKLENERLKTRIGELEKTNGTGGRTT